MASSSVSSVSVRIRTLDRHIINDNNDDDDKSSKSSRTTKRNHVKKRGGRRRYIHDENATVYISISSSSSSSSSNSSSLYDILRIKKDESLIVGDDDNDVIVCQLIRTEANNDDRSLSTPVIVRKLASLPITNNESSNALTTDTNNSSSDEADDGTTTTTKPPLLYIPPCLAATLGLMLMHNTITHTNTNNTMGAVCYLQPYQKHEIHIASHVTVRELGILPPLPIVKYPISTLDYNNNNVDDHGGSRIEKENNKYDMEEEEDGRELKHYFFSKVQKGQQSQNSDDTNNSVVNSSSSSSSSGGYKPRQRLLALGSIFAVPSSVQSNSMNENNAEKMLGGADDGALIQNVRFYQVVSVQCATNSIKNDSSLGDDIIPEISKDGQQQQQRRRLAYIISPSTQLVLLSCTTTTTTTDPINTMYDNSVVPKLNGYTARLPCITTTISFLRSISIAKMTKYNAHDLTRTDIVTTTTAAAATASHNSHNHPSVNDVIDALYLQSAIPSMKNSSRYNIGSITQYHTRIINIVGKEENHICHCIDEACNIS